MKRYKCIEIGKEAEDTEKMLNQLAQKGWSVVCSYAHNGNYLILEREEFLSL
jgi:hypothetical protein